MKKSLRVLFVLIFLLSLGSLSVQAQGAPTAIAYLPLLPHSVQSVSPEAATPGGIAQMHLLARQAYESLAPKLMQAQKSGQVVRFAPDLSAGMVMVEYVAGTNLASLLGTRQPVFATPQAVLAYTQAGLVMKKTLSAAAVTSPFIYLDQNGNCFSGNNLGANDTYRAYLKDTSGRLVGNAWGTLDSSGGFDNCFSGLWGLMVPGYAFNFKVYNSSGSTLLHTYTSSIPNSLAVSSVTTATKTAKGTAPVSSKLTISLLHPKLDATGEWIVTNKAATSSSAGAWQVNFSPAAMRGGDEVDAYWSKPATIFTFDSWLVAPFIVCGLGEAWCEITGTPAASASIFFKHGGSTFTSTGKFDPNGWFWAYLYDAHMQPIFLKAGDQGGGTGVKTLTLPSLTAIPNYASDTVTGVVPANGWFEVELDRYDPGTGWWDEYTRWVHSSATGTYSANFSSSVNITSADHLNLYVYFVNFSTGNETDYMGMIAP